MPRCQKWQRSTGIEGLKYAVNRELFGCFQRSTHAKKKRPGAQKTLNEGNGHLGARPQSVAPKAYEMPASAASGGIPAGISNVRLIELHFIPERRKYPANKGVFDAPARFTIASSDPDHSLRRTKRSRQRAQRPSVLMRRDVHEALLRYFKADGDSSAPHTVLKPNESTSILTSAVPSSDGVANCVDAPVRSNGALSSKNT